MAYTPLASPSDLESFAGSPFTWAAVNAASAAVRGEAGWHIAPQVTETLTVESYGGTLLPLPTRRIVSLTVIRDVTSGSTVLTDWKRIGLTLYRSSGWPIGTCEVDLTHGYTSTPEDLFPVIAARVGSQPLDARLSQRSATVGAVSESASFRPGLPTDPTIARYAVLAGVA